MEKAYAGSSALTGPLKVLNRESGNSMLVLMCIGLGCGAGGREYLKTENDGEQPRNSLSLPECP